MQKQWIGTNILRNRNASVTQSTYSLIQSAWRGLTERVKDFSSFRPVESIGAPVAVCCDGNTTVITEIQPSIRAAAVPFQTDRSLDEPKAESCGCGQKTNFWNRLSKESYSATLMVIKFMALAFFLEALIILYIPAEWIVGIMGRENAWAIITAAYYGSITWCSNLYQ
jgi:hypothetical protein